MALLGKLQRYFATILCMVEPCNAIRWKFKKGSSDYLNEGFMFSAKHTPTQHTHAAVVFIGR